MEEKRYRELEGEVNPDEPINDAYDLLQNLGSKVHTKTKRYNKDHTVSDLTLNERTFIRRQTRLIDQIVQYLAEKEAAKIAKRLLMADIEGVIILSRAKNGQVLKSILKAATGERNIEKDNQLLEPKKGFFQKLLG